MIAPLIDLLLVAGVLRLGLRLLLVAALTGPLSIVAGVRCDDHIVRQRGGRWAAGCLILGLRRELFRNSRPCRRVIRAGLIERPGQKVTDPSRRGRGQLCRA